MGSQAGVTLHSSDHGQGQGIVVVQPPRGVRSGRLVSSGLSRVSLGSQSVLAGIADRGSWLLKAFVLSVVLGAL